MKVTFLGTGTSQGVPVIGCTCAVCTSTDAKDQRLRTSLWVQTKEVSLVIDAGPDFRQQMLREKIDKIDAILITHEHNDHVIGLDDVRPFNFKYRRNMPIYATHEVQKSLRKRFAYAFVENPYPGAPGFDLRTIQAGRPFDINKFSILPILVWHGKLEVLGFRFGPFTYLTDVKTIPAASYAQLKGTEVLVLNALHHKAHYSHLNVEEALAVIDIIQPKKTYLTHVSHLMGLFQETNTILPEHVTLAYDGLSLSI